MAKYDRSYHGATQSKTGPLVSQLEDYGKLESLVVGPWGEGSKDLHLLIKTLAENKMAARVRGRGGGGSDLELGQVLSQIRRFLSLTNVRAQSLCLLARLCHLGDGAKEAAGRRGGKEGRRKEETGASEPLHGSYKRSWSVKDRLNICTLKTKTTFSRVSFY